MERAGIIPVAYSEEDAIRIALARRLDLANTRDALDDVEVAAWKSIAHAAADAAAVKAPRRAADAAQDMPTAAAR